MQSTQESNWSSLVLWLYSPTVILRLWLVPEEAEKTQSAVKQFSIVNAAIWLYFLKFIFKPMLFGLILKLLIWSFWKVCRPTNSFTCILLYNLFQIEKGKWTLNSLISQFHDNKRFLFFVAYEKESTHPPQWTVRWMGIRKDGNWFIKSNWCQTCWTLVKE